MNAEQAGAIRDGEDNDVRDVLVRRIEALSEGAILIKIGDRYSFQR